jgi:hypothetical protein
LLPIATNLSRFRFAHLCLCLESRQTIPKSSLESNRAPAETTGNNCDHPRNFTVWGALKYLPC